MIRKSDLKAAVDALPPGEPPSSEEIEAYLNGELSKEEEERLQTRLAHFPELARVFTEPFPDPHEAEVVEFAAASSRPLVFWRTAAIAAAVTAAVFGGLMFQSQSKARRLTSELTRPRTDLENALLLPDGQRGNPDEEAPITLPASGEDLLLMPALIHQPEFRDYRVDILDLNVPAPRPVWSSTGIRRRSDDTFEIWVPRTFLNPGIYQLVVYGIDGTMEPLAKYTVKVPRRAGQSPS